MGHIWVIFGSYLGHMWVMIGSYLGHIWVIVGSWLGHIWDHILYVGKSVVAVLVPKLLIFCILGNLWSPSVVAVLVPINGPNLSRSKNVQENVPPLLWTTNIFCIKHSVSCICWVNNCTSTSLGEVFPVIPTSPISISLDIANFVKITIAWSDLVRNVINPDRRSTSTQVQTILSLMLLLERIQEISLKRYQNI